MKKKRKLYPGDNKYDATRLPPRVYTPKRNMDYDDEPDFLPGTPITPNYEKFEKMGKSIEEILVYLNID